MSNPHYIYMFFIKSKCVYVGRTECLKKRFKNHKHIYNVDEVLYTAVEACEIHSAEHFFIQKHLPDRNIDLKNKPYDGKDYSYLHFTVYSWKYERNVYMEPMTKLELSVATTEKLLLIKKADQRFPIDKYHVQLLKQSHSEKAIYTLIEMLLDYLVEYKLMSIFQYIYNHFVQRIINKDYQSDFISNNTDRNYMFELFYYADPTPEDSPTYKLIGDMISNSENPVDDLKISDGMLISFMSNAIKSQNYFKGIEVINIISDSIIEFHEVDHSNESDDTESLVEIA